MKTGLVLLAILASATSQPNTTKMMATIPLPEPRLESGYSVEEALLNRRSVRDFSAQPITLAELGQLLWAAQGVTSRNGYRTAPSAGALYPLEVYAVVGAVEGLAPGIYGYQPGAHELEARRAGDYRSSLSQAALGQQWIRDSAAILVFCAVSSRTTAKYGRRGESYILMEVGHAGQNVFLQAQALGLSAVVVGAFRDAAVNELLTLPRGENALYLMPIGHKALR